ncbi:hypothetical protein DAPPUDRAFT_262140 [Daphnia pulex]|uniref:Uncharacterized protein n=1 Tax=Daphnia pulex TaxID=6669 RepID=E9HMF9_DAPPU|nr:hypothetical protein DAPPUDRAFT_262140 [Daphnia pulex]|eukprot:EFX67066.1 hypothetical protein DAPPUDRAFT_262140 [Daphnia pulex]
MRIRKPTPKIPRSDSEHQIPHPPPNIRLRIPHLTPPSAIDWNKFRNPSQSLLRWPSTSNISRAHSTNSAKPPTTASFHLTKCQAFEARECTCEKNRHTKLINQPIAYFGSKQKLAVHRASLADQLEDCIAANKYIRTPRSSVHSVVVDEATLNNTSRGQPDNVNSIVGTSVLKSRSQVPKSAVIMNQIQQRLRREIQLRRNVEEKLSKATATKTEMTINSAKLSEKSNVTLSFNKKCNNKLSRWRRQEKHEEAELQY